MYYVYSLKCNIAEKKEEISPKIIYLRSSEKNKIL